MHIPKEYLRIARIQASKIKSHLGGDIEGEAFLKLCQMWASGERRPAYIAVSIRNHLISFLREESKFQIMETDPYREPVDTSGLMDLPEEIVTQLYLLANGMSDRDLEKIYDIPRTTLIRRLEAFREA